MKPGHKYLVNPPKKKAKRSRRKNPAPFAMVVANVAGRKRRAKSKRRNPTKARAGISIVRMPKKNPAPLPDMKTKRRRNKKRRNPLSNLGRFFEKKRRNPTKRRSSSRRRRNSASKISSVNPMAKRTRKRGSRRRRNPIARRGARRRNPGRRSSRRRNPIPVVRELFGPDMLTFAGGVVAVSVGTSMLMNRILAGNPTTGQPGMKLPLVDYTPLANPATAGQFYARNAWILAGYKLAIGGLLGYALRNQAPRFSRGVMVGAVATAISDVLKNTGVLNAAGNLQIARAGTARNYPGVAGLVPGVPARLAGGPASAFLRKGMSARVNAGTMRSMENQTEGAFRGAN